jgi:hypothetical protein
MLPLFFDIDLVHVLSLDQTGLFERLDHAVDSRHPDTVIDPAGAVINFFAAAAFIFEDDVNQDSALIGDSAAVFLEFIHDIGFLRFHGHRLTSSLSLLHALVSID